MECGCGRGNHEIGRRQKIDGLEGSDDDGGECYGGDPDLMFLHICQGSYLKR